MWMKLVYTVNLTINIYRKDIIKILLEIEFCKHVLEKRKKKRNTLVSVEQIKIQWISVNCDSDKGDFQLIGI